MGGVVGNVAGGSRFRILVRVDAKIVTGRGQGGVLGRDPWGPAERARGGWTRARARNAGEVVRVSAATRKRGLVAGGARGEDVHANGTLPMGLLGRRGGKGGSGCHA